jgi:multimeric flavodoxin WrbA
MGKNIVILSGSPRKGGTTDRLTRAFMEGADSAGNSVSCFRVADQKIAGCLGCGHCFREPGVCAQRDGMTPILEKLKKADALVLASPIYYFNVSAQLKLAIDRMYALLKLGTPVKRSALLLTCGDETDQAAASAIAMFRQISGYLRWEEAGVVVVPGLTDVNDIDGRKELEDAKKLGRDI